MQITGKCVNRDDLAGIFVKHDVFSMISRRAEFFYLPYSVLFDDQFCGIMSMV